MHLLPVIGDHPSPERVRDRHRAEVMAAFSRHFNYRDRHSGPRVTVPRMRSGGISVACSALYSAFDELEPGDKSPGGPRAEYFDNLLREMGYVDDDVSKVQAAEAEVVTTRAGLDAALASNKLAIVHCVEGGFRLGETPEAIDANVRTLKRRGVVYITLAHLFFRGVASNAPALPALGPDCVYDVLFATPDVGLTHLGRAAVESMHDAGILVDIAHMSERAVHETLDLLDVLDARTPGKTTAVLASHSACRLGNLAYNLSDRSLRRVAERGGVVGLLMCPHFILDGSVFPPAEFVRRTLRRLGIMDILKGRQLAIDALCRHIERAERVMGSHDGIALGSDLDGFVKPTLDGIDMADDLRHIDAALHARFDATIADNICHGNALRLIRQTLA